MSRVFFVQVLCYTNTYAHVCILFLMPGFLQWMLIFHCFMTLIIIPIIYLESLTFNKEKMNGMYSVGQACISRALVDIPFACITGILCVTPGQAVVSREGNSGERYSSFVAVFALTMYAAESQALLVATFVPNFLLALLLYMCLTTTDFLFCGHFVNTDLLPDYWGWLQYCSYMMYASESLLYIELHDRTFSPCSNTTTHICFCAPGVECPGKTVLNTLSSNILPYSDGSMGLGDLPLGTWVAILAGISVLFRFAHYLVLATGTTLI